MFPVVTTPRTGVNLEIMKWFASCTLLACLIVPARSPASAQKTIVKQGATVRLRPVGDERFHSAQIHRITRDSVVLERCLDCNRLSYRRNEVAKLDVFQPYAQSSRTFKGICLGTTIGGGLGYLAATSCSGGDRCDLAALAVPFGAITGALIGGVAGFVSAYRWQPVIASAR